MLSLSPSIGVQLTNSNWCVLLLKIDIFGTEILRVTTLLENATVLSQSGLDHPSPLSSGGGMYQNARADLSGWASQFPSEV